MPETGQETEAVLETATENETAPEAEENTMREEKAQEIPEVGTENSSDSEKKEVNQAAREEI